MKWYQPFVLAALFASACHSSDAPDGSVQPGADGPLASPADLSVPGDAAVALDGGTDGAIAVLGCIGNVATCSTYDTRSYCTPGPTGPVWMTESCPSGCFAGKCSTTACANECVLGASSPAGTCKLWDMNAQGFVSADPVGKLHDRARNYDQVLRAIDMPEGTVLNAIFTDQTYSMVQLYAGTHDGAIWTGSALAMQSWRLLATGNPDAAKQVDAMVHTLHTAYNVTGDPSYLARLVVPATSTTPLETASPCTNSEWHCNASYAGQTYNWLGYTSRDAYTGVMLGYYLAYLATPDEALRQLIRQDVVNMVLELMKSRAVPATIVVNNLPGFNKTLNLENVILAPSEMVNGRVLITISSSSTSDAGLSGMREFLPDFETLVSQAIGITIPVPRSSSTIMLGAFFQEAILMSDQVPGLETVHQQILDYYNAHADNWLSIAEQWTFTSNCGHGYFANHIAFIMAYVYAMLESNPSFAPRIRDNVLNSAMWGALSGHKNSYFGFLWGATRPSPTQTAIDSAVAQLTQFSPGPRIHVARDNTAAPQYMPHDSTCTMGADVLCDTATLAVDVKDRVVDDFIWQRQPWSLVDPGNLNEVYPGVDYLAAYWAGRYHGFLSDDRAGTCTRYAP